MKNSKRYSPKSRERAVHMEMESAAQHASQWATIKSISGKLGCALETLCRWVREHRLLPVPQTPA